MLMLSEFAERKELNREFLVSCGLHDTDRGLCFPYYGPIVSAGHDDTVLPGTSSTGRRGQSLSFTAYVMV